MKRKALARVTSDERPANAALLALTEQGLRGVVIGTIIGLDPRGFPRVTLLEDAHGEALSARSCQAITLEHVGSSAVLTFERGDPRRPIVLGILVAPGTSAPGAKRHELLDGKALLLTAKDSITLKCGDASITLDQSGKITIRGANVVSHASGVNRIRGGSIQLN